jgi:hypothetical protein
VVELIPYDRAVRDALRKENVSRDVEELEIPWHYSDDLMGDEIHENHPPEHVGVAAESSLPVSVREDNGSLSALCFIVD